MKIIILGAGQVGGTLTENLVREDNDITLVDTQIDRLRDLQDHLDIRTVHGMGCYPDILEQAGAREADMLIAVTNSDEINMLACQMAYSLFKVPTKIARIRAHNYSSQTGLFADEQLPVDVIISPEQAVTHYIERLIEHPGALQVLDFADGAVQLVAIKAKTGGPLVGRALHLIKKHMPNIDTRVAAVFRKNHAIKPEGDTLIEHDDEVFFVVDSQHTKTVMRELRKAEPDYQRVMIAGGGNIGQRLAKALETQYRVKLIDHNANHCRHLAETLSHTLILQGNASDRDLLLEEHIEDIDIFIALTNDDEANIMSSLLAKRLGVKKVMALISNPAYVDLVQGGEIDIAISPQQITISSLLSHIRKGDVLNVHSLRRGAAEAMEIVAHGDAKHSQVVGHALGKIDFPKGTSVGAIVRNNQVLIAHDDLVIETGDHVILFVLDKQTLPKIEKLFQIHSAFI